MNIWELPDGSTLLIAATSGASALKIVRAYRIRPLVFHQNAVLDGQSVEMDQFTRDDLVSRGATIYELPPKYGRSLLSDAYREALRGAGEGVKVAFELMLYALERGIVSPGQTIYAAAGTKKNIDSLVQFVVPTIGEFNSGGYSSFSILTGDAATESRVKSLLHPPNEYARIVLLYHPKAYPERDYAWTPFSVLSIAAVVPPRFVPYIIDNNSLCRESFADEIRAISHKLVVVGISSMIGNQINDMLRFLTDLRRSAPHVPVVVGGPLPTILGDLTLQHPMIDFVIRSQGEIPFIQLLSSLETPHEWATIQGLGYKAGGTRQLNPLQKIHKKSEFPPYPFDLVDLTQYIRPAGAIGRRVLSYISSQGCSFSCAFCSDMLIFQKKWTTKNEDQIITDLRYFRDTFNVDGVKFYDSNLLISHTRVQKFCGSLVDAEIGLNYATSIHPRVMATLSEAEMDLLRRSGCKRLLIGTESGNDHELVMIKKGATVDDMLECAARLKQLEIVGTFTLIIGLPGSTVETLRESVELGRQIAAIWPEHEVKMQVYQPYPGTELYQQFKVPGAYEPTTLEEWGLEAFDTTPSPHRDFHEYLRKVQRRHPQLFTDVAIPPS